MRIGFPSYLQWTLGPYISEGFCNYSKTKGRGSASTTVSSVAYDIVFHLSLLRDTIIIGYVDDILIVIKGDTMKAKQNRARQCLAISETWVFGSPSIRHRSLYSEIDVIRQNCDEDLGSRIWGACSKQGVDVRRALARHRKQGTARRCLLMNVVHFVVVRCADVGTFSRLWPMCR